MATVRAFSCSSKATTQGGWSSRSYGSTKKGHAQCRPASQQLVTRAMWHRSDHPEQGLQYYQGQGEGQLEGWGPAQHLHQDATACSGGGSGPGHPPTEATYGDDGPRRDHPQVLLPCALLMLAVTFGCGVYKFAHKLMTGCGDQLWLGITQLLATAILLYIFIQRPPLTVMCGMIERLSRTAQLLLLAVPAVWALCSYNCKLNKVLEQLEAGVADLTAQQRRIVRVMDAALTQHDLLEEARFKGLAEKLDELSNKRDARLMHLCGQLDYMRAVLDVRKEYRHKRSAYGSKGCK